VADDTMDSAPPEGDLATQTTLFLENAQGLPETDLDTGMLAELNEVKNPFTDDNGAPYSVFKIVETYECDEGLIQSGVASADPQAACVFIRTHSPTWRLRVDWTVEREGLPPLAPSSKRNDENLFLLKRIYGNPTQVPVTNAVKVWRLSGCYIYGLQVPIDPETAGLPGVATPLLTDTQSELGYPPSSFTSDFLS
jgi:hypothetical protein